MKLSNTILFLATVVVCVIGVELGFRAYNGVPLFALVNWRAEREVVSPSIFDPTLGWIQKPNLSVENFPLHTTDYGIRKNRPDETSVPTGGVLVTGDSFAAGSQVTDEETWPAQLEDMIQQPVVNAASGAYGIDQMVLRAEQLLPIVHPQTIIVGTERDGIFRVTYSSYVHPKPYFRIVDGALVEHGVTAENHTADDRYGSLFKQFLGYSFLVDQLMVRYAPHYWERVWEEKVEQTNEDAVEVSCLLLQRLKKDADQYGARLLLVMQYGGDVNSSENGQPSDASMVDHCAEELGIQVVDEFATLHAIAKRSMAEFRTEYIMGADGRSFGHMSSQGNRLIAQLIAATLRTKPPVPTADELAKFQEERHAAQLTAEPDLADARVIWDGKNHLVSAAKLEQFSAPPIASLTVAAAGPSPEYELSAQGEKSEHYVSLPLDPATSGPYRLTVQIKSLNRANVRLQILDQASDAAIADIDMSRDYVTPTRLGHAQVQKAEAAALSDHWHEVSLIAALPENGARVVVQLLSAGTEGSFQPSGEAIRFRNLRVEGGHFSAEKTAQVR